MPTAIVTGANRGLGKETARQLLAKGYTVVVTARKLAAAEAAAAELGTGAIPFQLDITSDEQAGVLAAFVADRFGQIDALVNNAGVISDDPGRARVMESSAATLLANFDTNTVGAWRVTHALLPLLGPGSNVVNVSSGMGALGEMGTGYPAYRLSKAALNALTILFHNEEGHRGIRFNAVCPGWVKTDMGGPGATRDVEHGASGIVWAATLDNDGPSGGFFRDGTRIDW